MAARRGQGEFRFYVRAVRTDEMRGLLFDVMKRMEDFRPVWPRVARVLARGEQDIIASRGAALGYSPWPELKATYLRRKRRQGFSSEPLVRTGRMLMRLTSATGGTLIASAKHLQFGVRLRQAAAINFGVFKTQGAHGGRRLRARPIVGWTGAMKTEVLDEMADYVGTIVGENKPSNRREAIRLGVAA